jgi:hypothetical protein
VYLIAFVRLYLAVCTYRRDTARPSMLLVRSWLLAAVMDRLYRSNADDAERIRAMTLSDDVSDDYSTHDGTECDREYVEPRDGDSESAKDVTSDDQALLTIVSLQRTRRSGVR